MAGLVLPKVDNEFFGLVDIQDQAVISAPARQLLHLFSVGQVLVIPDEAYHCCVILKFHDVICDMPRDAIMCHQGEQQRTQDTTLRGACTEGDDARGILSNPY